ncbi:hypothetical protein COU97_02035 [Candidatus Shapirobacteria bacterium CG10_big_fil_rev_8_21_14_0_10_48_15]|uniref:Membrane protein 6-pyruvoyl-tetrahydropterin synthase-related domain-containing protein n=1 Tax=Candidatus Shapirobacteria bacterium CG10_big_fil_rev_8_21_14_0_10_48_15 TaxID=1974484 RepID=A0A2M8L6Z5_9BACT|nr:MAG: hypothetical protein COU97_02035 [Candidatus Shapirobacteria bacterium CG10_big_fil_rev_8_21_14_0_10_48_15]
MGLTRQLKKKGDLLAILAFVILTAIIFRNYFFKGQVPFPANLLVSFYSPWRHYQWEGYPNGPATKPIGFDNLRSFFPYRKFTLDQLKLGQWPLWNPYNFSGNIHLATYQAAVFYPLNLLYFVLPLIDAWSWLVILQPILAGFFMFLFLRKINLSSRAAFFGALTLAFSGWMLAWSEESLVIEHTALWLPLILYALEKLMAKVSPGRVALLVGATVAMILAGFLQLTIYVLLTVFAWIIFRVRQGKLNDLKSKLALGLSFLVSLLITSAHLWPAIEAYFNSSRRLVDVKFLFDQYLMPPWHLITFLAPDFWGNPGVFNYFQGGFYHEKVIYLGIPALLLALFALLSKRRSQELNFLKWFSLITLALGFVPLGWLLYFSHLPLVSTMMPARIFFLATFGFCALAAFGWDFYSQQNFAEQRWKSLFFASGSIFLLLWLFVFYHKFFLVPDSFATVSLRNLVLPTGFFISTASVIWLFRRQKSFAFLALTALAVLSSIYFANKFLYFSERRFIFPEVAVLTKLKAMAGVNRVWGYAGGCLERNLNAYYGLYSPDGYEALFPQRYGELLHVQETKGQLTGQPSRSDAAIKQAVEADGVLDSWYRQRLLSLLGVKYLAEAKFGEGKNEATEAERFPQEFFQLVWQDEKFRIWEYQQALPRAFLVDEYLVETQKQKIIDHLFDQEFSLAKKIILEEEPGLKIEPQATKKTVEITKYLPNQVELQTESLQPALLFLTDNDYPGWQAQIDGQRAAILRADFTFRAVAVPAGKHQIVFSYRPKAFFWGLRVSFLSLILFIGWLIFVKIKRP